MLATSMSTTCYLLVRPKALTLCLIWVRLVDAVTGAHLWAENYERAFSPDKLFELQDDLVIETDLDHWFPIWKLPVH